MTETKEETPVEAKLFGTADAREHIEAYNEAISKANAEHVEAYTASDASLNAAKEAVRKLLSGSTDARNAASGVNDLLSALSLQTRNAQRATADQTYNTAITSAKAARDKALGDDPFTGFVSTYIADNFREFYAYTFYAAMPVSYEGLKALAFEESWCANFESVMLQAVRRGALPDDKVRVTRSVQSYQVTSEHNAQPGETWTVTFEVPAFVRTVDAQGHDRSFPGLGRYASNISFQRVDKPGEKDTSQS